MLNFIKQEFLCAEHSFQLDEETRGIVVNFL